MSAGARRRCRAEEIRKQRLDNRAARMRYAAQAQERRLNKKKEPPRSRSSRTAAALQQDPRGWRPRAGAGAKWAPTNADIVEVLAVPGIDWMEQRRVVIAVNLAAANAMLDWLVPRCKEVTGAKIAARNGRGSSMILTADRCTSGAHADGMGTIIYCHVGRREVWIAEPKDTDDSLPRVQSGVGAREPKLLADVCDPVTSPQTAKQYLTWRKPVECDPGTVHTGAILNPGEAIFIPEGWWHSVCADRDSDRKRPPGAVGIALEVACNSMNVSCRTKPYMFGRCGSSSRRAVWKSWKECMRVWEGLVNN